MFDSTQKFFRPLVDRCVPVGFRKFDPVVLDAHDPAVEFPVLPGIGGEKRTELLGAGIYEESSCL